MDKKSLYINLDAVVKERQEYFKVVLEQGWGSWKYDPECNALVYQDSDYFIEITRINSCFNLVDWLLHLKEKTWVTNDDLADFLTAVDDLSGGLRGKDKFKLDVLNLRAE